MDKKELLFEMYKDQVVISKKFKNEMKKKYHLDTKEASDLFVRINNYQIKTYGGKLEFNLGLCSKEELEQRHFYARCRRYHRQGTTYENHKHNRKYDYL